MPECFMPGQLVLAQDGHYAIVLDVRGDNLTLFLSVGWRVVEPASRVTALGLKATDSPWPRRAHFLEVLKRTR